MTPPEDVKRKFDGMEDSGPPDKGREVVDRELTHQ